LPRKEDPEMSLFFQVKSSYWRLRAEETRVLAETMTTNLHAYGVILKIADEYECQSRLHQLSKPPK
jgi:hypothetical protein